MYILSIVESSWKIRTKYNNPWNGTYNKQRLLIRYLQFQTDDANSSVQMFSYERIRKRAHEQNRPSPSECFPERYKKLRETGVHQIPYVVRQSDAYRRRKWKENIIQYPLSFQISPVEKAACPANKKRKLDEIWIFDGGKSTSSANLDIRIQSKRSRI